MMVYASYLSSCRVLYFHKRKFDIYKSRSIYAHFVFLFFRFEEVHSRHFLSRIVS